MIPKKDHFQIIIKELEKFDADLETSYNFQEFFDRCRAIFSPSDQVLLNQKIYFFQKRFLIDTITAQNLLYQIRVVGRGGKPRLKIVDSDGMVVKSDVNIVALEYGLRDIYVWCRKILIRMVKDEQINFDEVPSIDLRGVS